MTSILAQLLGRSLLSARIDDITSETVFSFSGDVHLRIAAPWRIVAENRIPLGYEDHDQPFGLPTPVDAAGRFADLVVNRKVADATVHSLGDLVVEMEGGSRVDVFNASSGYEAWMLTGPDGRWIVGQGGGVVVRHWE